MRVLHVIPSVSPSRGGPSAVIFPMVAALRARGIEAEIATSDDDAGTSDRPQLARDEYRDVPIRFFSRWNAPLRPLRDYTFCPRFTSWLKRNICAYDLLHVHALFSHLPGAAMWIARNHGVPYISRPLGQLGRWPLRQSALRKRLYLRLLEKQNLLGAHALHFTSDRERVEAADCVPTGASAVIPHGIEPPPLLPDARGKLRSQLGLAPGQKLVLFLGRVHPKKGIDWLVHALARMPAPRPILLIAGEGAHRAEIERLACRKGVDRHLRWLGQVAGEWKNVCLQGADVFALTSRHENFGVAVLEALAAGTPVLVSNQVALADEIARHRLGLVVPLEIAAIRDGLAPCLQPPNDDDAARRRTFVRDRYSWRANAAALDQLYRGIIEKSHWPK